MGEMIRFNSRITVSQGFYEGHKGRVVGIVDEKFYEVELYYVCRRLGDNKEFGSIIVKLTEEEIKVVED